MTLLLHLMEVWSFPYVCEYIRKSKMQKLVTFFCDFFSLLRATKFEILKPLASLPYYISWFLYCIYHNINLYFWYYKFVPTEQLCSITSWYQLYNLEVCIKNRSNSDRPIQFERTDQSNSNGPAYKRYLMVIV